MKTAQGSVPVMRVARATNDLAPLRRFYRDGLGFEEISGFENHDGFDGAMMGHPAWPYHLEFTVRHGHYVSGASTPENLLVFYLPDAADWTSAVVRMEAAGFDPVEPANPWWSTHGRTFEDADGYRVVLENRAWVR